MIKLIAIFKQKDPVEFVRGVGFMFPTYSYEERTVATFDNRKDAESYALKSESEEINSGFGNIINFKDISVLKGAYNYRIEEIPNNPKI